MRQRLPWRPGQIWSISLVMAIEADTKVDLLETSGCRELGTAQEDFLVPDDFDAPLPDEILSEFER